MPGSFGAPDERPGEPLPRREPGMFDQCACGSEPGEVSGLGENRRRTQRGQAGDRGGQLAQVQLVQDGGHPGFGLGQPSSPLTPVRQQQLHPLQRADRWASTPAGSASATNSFRTIRRHGRSPPRRVNSRRTGCSNRPRPSRRVRSKTPSSRSTITVIAAAHGIRPIPGQKSSPTLWNPRRTPLREDESGPADPEVRTGRDIRGNRPAVTGRPRHATRPGPEPLGPVPGRPQVISPARSSSEATDRSGAVKYAGYPPPVRLIQAVPSPARAAPSMSHGCTATSMASSASTPHSVNA